MGLNCFCSACGNALDLSRNNKPARTESCSRCGADLHSCMNCRFHDKDAYNECRELQAERVVDKQKSNFCDYFSFRDGKPDDAGSQKADVLKKLDDLFK